METQKTVIQAKPVTLSLEDQDELLKFIKHCWDQGKKERKPYMEDSKACDDAYHCRMEPITSPELDWMSNICLPWAYDAVESWYAHIHSTTIPKNDQIFQVSGRTEEDHPGADCMQKYMEYRFERNKFPKQLGRAEKMLGTKNHTCLKTYWKEVITVDYPWVDEPITEIMYDEMVGMPVEVQTGVKKVRKPQERIEFNNVWTDVIELDDFVFWPIHGEFNKTTRIHRTYQPYEELMTTAQDNTNYFNLDQLSIEDEKQYGDAKKGEADVANQTKGIKLKEAWIHRVRIGDKVYRNYVATLANDKTIIRFQPFPPGCPDSPFTWKALRQDGNCLYGYGLISKGLGILNAANKRFNQWIDEGTLTLHQAHKYFDDGVYNPHNVVRRPGAQIKMASADSVERNLQPMIDDMSKGQQAMADLMVLKKEFEEVTVPMVVKGLIETGRDTTATEQRYAQNNSSGKMNIDGFGIGDDLIQPVLSKTYQAIYDRAQWDEDVIQEITQVTQPKDPQTGAPLQQLPILPLPNIDIKVVGYQNVIRKQETLMGMSQAIPQLMQSPAAPYMKWGNVAEDTLNLLDLDTTRLLQNDDEQKETDARAQQAAQQEQELMVIQEKAKLDLQADKQNKDHEIKLRQMELDAQMQQAELAIKEIELQIKQQELELKTREQAHAEKLGIHGALMSERDADFQENQAERDRKDKQKDKKK